MKKQIFIFLILGAFAFNLQVSAQTNFNAFWTKFKAAVRAKNKNVVAALTRFPLAMPYGMTAIKTRAQMNARFDKIFNGEADAAQCFATEKPVRETASRYSVACGFKNDESGSAEKPIVYIFERTRAGWRFAALDNINE